MDTKETYVCDRCGEHSSAEILYSPYSEEYKVEWCNCSTRKFPALAYLACPLASPMSAHYQWWEYIPNQSELAEEYSDDF